MFRALCLIALGAMTLSACSDDEPGGTGASSGSSNGSTGGAASSAVSTGNGAGASGPGSGGGGGSGGGSGGGISCEFPAGTTTEPHVHVVYLVRVAVPAVLGAGAAILFGAPVADWLQG